MTEPKKPLGWERIEADYRAGVMSIREIAACQRASHVAWARRRSEAGS